MNFTNSDIIRVISEFADKPVSDYATTLQDLELDSLDQVELAMELEEELGIDLGDASFNSNHTVNDVIAACWGEKDAS